MWNYLPKIKKTIRVPPSMMMSSWMGSDFTNDDMVRESSWQDDYSAKMLAQPPKGQKCLDYRAKPNAAVAWDRVVACVHADKYYPIRQAFYDEKGRKARVMEFGDVKNLGGRLIPSRMTLTPLTPDKKGNRTVVVYEELKFDVSVPDSLFSLSNLRRGG
jgi:outer membrane lipoprotein-sorting protein